MRLILLPFDCCVPQMDTGQWNSPSFNGLVSKKTEHQLAAVSRGFDILFSDCDIAWLQDFRCSLYDTTQDVELYHAGMQPTVRRIVDDCFLLAL